MVPHTPVEASKLRRRLALFIATAVVLGIATKLYSGPGDGWIRRSSGGIFYVAFFTFLFVWIRPGASPGLVAMGVFVITTGLEVLQLWHPPALERVRGSLIGRTLIGGHFAWADIPFYAVGALGAALVLRRLKDGTPR